MNGSLFGVVYHRDWCWDLYFFYIYINDFTLEISKIFEVIMFAHDTSILCTAKDFNNLKIKQDIVLMHMSMWFQRNQFALNLDKSQR
jgi:hypothetical protein